MLDKKGVKVYLILACNEDGIIGENSSLPWNFRKDLQYFKALTTHRVLVMGSKTARSFPPLPDRISLVLTSKPQSFSEPYIPIKDFQEAIDWCVSQGRDELMVIGGSQVYARALEFYDVIYFNLIEDFPITGDGSSSLSFFPLEKIIGLRKRLLQTFEDVDRKTGKSYRIKAFKITLGDSGIGDSGIGDSGIGDSDNEVS